MVQKSHSQPTTVWMVNPQTREIMVELVENFTTVPSTGDRRIYSPTYLDFSPTYLDFSPTYLDFFPESGGQGHSQMLHVVGNI